MLYTPLFDGSTSLDMLCSCCVWYKAIKSYMNKTPRHLCTPLTVVDTLFVSLFEQT